MQYRLLLDLNNEVREDMILRISDDGIQSFVPNNPQNADWQAYQAWLELDNEPEPAE